jgi:hypothetical protein
VRRAALVSTPVAIALAVTLAVASALGGCNDVRDFRGPWEGPRVGSAEVLKVGIADTATAHLDIATVDRHGLAGTLVIPGVISTAAPVVSVPGAEADALADISFTGDPLRVYLAFVAVDDGAGEALAVIALYDDDRVEIRLLRGGTAAIYAVFTLTAQT